MAYTNTITQGPKIKYVLMLFGVAIAYFIIRQYFYSVEYTENAKHIDFSKFKPIKKFVDPEGCPKIHSCEHLKCEGDNYDRIIRFRDDGCRECACVYVPRHEDE